MKIDLKITNGRIVDPKSGTDQKGTILVKDRKIYKILFENAGEEYQASHEIKAEECIVCPGLIDVHTHFNYKNQANGMPVDLAGIPSGVTATVDAGSTGVSTYKGFLKNLNNCETKTKIMLNVSAGGIIMPTQYPEPVNPSYWDLSLFDEAFEHYGESIVGLKIRVGRDVLGDLGAEVLDRTIELAERYHTRVIVHPTNSSLSMSEIAKRLRKGDVFTHMYHGEGGSILDEKGHIYPEILEARKRGVQFDCATGKANTLLSVVRKALKENFLPDTISTDLTLTSWNHPWIYSLPIVMSKYMALGLSFDQVLKCVTVNAAAQFSLKEEWGALEEGRNADLAILRVAKKECDFADKYGDSVHGHELIKPLATIINGQVMYQAVELF